MSNRNQRRQIQKLQVAVDKACAADAAYFERRPNREHRLRRSFKAEVLQNHLMSSGEMDSRLEPGLGWFTIVKNLCCGTRLRMFVKLPDGGADPDLTHEEICRELFEALVERNPKLRTIEADMRRISCGEAAT